MLARVVQDYIKLEIAYAESSFYENCYPYFGYDICSIPNNFGFKIFNESILLGFNWTLYMHTPSPQGQQPWRLPEWTSKKLNELLWVSLNSMYSLKYQLETK